MDFDYLIIKNPDEKERAEIIRRIKAKNGYCPSKFEISPDTKCNCKVFRQTGICECGLFLSVPVREIGA